MPDGGLNSACWLLIAFGSMLESDEGADWVDCCCKSEANMMMTRQRGAHSKILSSGHLLASQKLPDKYTLQSPYQQSTLTAKLRVAMGACTT